MNHDSASAAGRLTIVVQQENAALTALDFGAAMRLLGAKRDAVTAFEAAARGGHVAQLHELETLREAALANTTLIERAILVQRRIIETVIRAMPKADAATRYRPDAGMARARRTVPVTLHAHA